MYLNTVFKYNVFKYCPALVRLYLFHLQYIITTQLSLHNLFPLEIYHIFANKIRSIIRKGFIVYYHQSIQIYCQFAMCLRIKKSRLSSSTLKGSIIHPPLREE